MKDVLYLAWRYLSYHRVKTGILVMALTLILYLPVGLRVLVDQSSRQLTARAEATPLLVGVRGSPLELVLSTLYFGTDDPAPTRFAEAQRVQESGLATAIPIYVRFEARGRPIVGTTLDYFEFRGLRVVEGRRPWDPGYCFGLRFTHIPLAARFQLRDLLSGLPPPVPSRPLRPALAAWPQYH